ncbi:MAG: inositol monophosphatase family protein [Gulosibacter sp.]|uniref:inositol monophosphatase family protein n=1 Tax=Gulosibacter sp. TaxID=2817531 RepID=UPI003F8F1857
MSTPIKGVHIQDAIEELAIRAARACGRFIFDERPEHVDVAATKSSATDVVTEMDRAGEALIREVILANRPRDGFLGEEGNEVVGDSGITWVVDPIDGTVNYLYDIPSFAVSVAAVEGSPSVDGDWRPLVGVVLNPVLDEMYVASRGRGAWLAIAGTRRALMITEVDQSQALIATGFNYTRDTREWQGRVVSELLPNVRDVRRMGSAALDLCHVASGRVNASYESCLHAWDFAAGWLIVEESGGVVRGLDGGRPSPDLVLAGPESLVAELARMIVPSTRRAFRPYE